MQPAGISNVAWAAIYQKSGIRARATRPAGVHRCHRDVSPTDQLEEVPVDQVGTWGGYVQLLDNEASYLGQLGEDVTDVNQLWGFAVQQADNALSPVGPDLASATDDSVAIPGSLSLSFSRVFASSITGRDTMGPLGLGWSTPWQTTATHGLRRHGDHHRSRRRPARLPARFPHRRRILLRARRHRHAHG